MEKFCKNNFVDMLKKFVINRTYDSTEIYCKTKKIIIWRTTHPPTK